MKKALYIVALIFSCKTFVGQVNFSGNSVVGSQSSALGSTNQLNATQGTAIGYGNEVFGSQSFASGNINTVYGNQNMAMGYMNTIRSYAITYTLGKTVTGSIATGIDNRIAYNSSGSATYHETTGSGVFGGYSAVGGQFCYSIGLRTLAGVSTYTTATTSTIYNAFAIGMNATADANNAMMIGSGLYGSSNTDHGKDVKNSVANSLAITFSKQSQTYTPTASRPTFFVGEANENSSGYAKYGTVGIGTNDTKGHTLGVRGDIIAEKIQVAIYASPWPDYVFSKDYSLAPLVRVEEYIKQNNHLPNLPAAKEIEQNGYDLANMDAKLLEKVEELTLYMIEMSKQLETIKKENIELKSQIKNLTK